MTSPAHDPSTSAFVRAAVAGGNGEFAALYERVAPGLFAWAAVRIHGTARGSLDPEDLVQEVWCHALQGFAAYDPERAGFRPWIFGIANNVLLTALRRFYRRRTSEPRTAGGSPFDLERVPDEVTTLSGRIAKQEALQRFLAQVLQLPEEERRLLVYRGFEGLPHTEVARRLGLEPATVRKRWERLRERLRELPVPDGTVADD